MDKRRVLQTLAVVALCLLIYWPSLKNGYIWDDDQYVYNNPAVTNPGGMKDIWLTHAMPQYYPMVFTSFRLEHLAWGGGPAGYHAVNTTLHAANALLLLTVLSAVAPGTALAAALLFAAHPMQVETVAWITERKNLLALFFLLWTSLFYLRFYRTARPASWLGAFLFYTCALLSKSAAAWFAIAPMVHAWWATGRITRKDIVISLPFLATGAAAGLHTAWLEATKVGAAGETWNLDVLAHILLASRISVFYLYKALVPLEFVFFYPRWTISATVWWQWIFPVMVIGAFIIVFITRQQTRRAGPALLLLYGASLFPVLGFFNVYPMRFSYVADHFAYMASPVIFLAIGSLVLPAWDKVQTGLSSGGRTAAAVKWSGRCAAVLVIMLLSVKSAALVENYKNEVTLWKNVVEKNPASYAAWNNLGTAYGKIRRHDAAVPCFEKALELRPDLAKHAVNLGNALLNTGRADRALPVLQKALELDPRNGEAHHLAAIACYNLRLVDCAQVHCRQALELGAQVKPELIEGLARISRSCPE